MGVDCGPIIGRPLGGHHAVEVDAVGGALIGRPHTVDAKGAETAKLDINLL